MGKGLTIKFEQQEKRGGLAVIRKKRRELKIETLISYRVRCSKHVLMSRFKVDYELMPGC